jgi:hypothetical protein
MPRPVAATTQLLDAIRSGAGFAARLNALAGVTVLVVMLVGFTLFVPLLAQSATLVWLAWTAIIIAMAVFRRSDTNSTRSWLRFAVIVSVFNLAVLWGGYRIAFAAREVLLCRAARRAQPLVEAIKKFETDYGHPPASIDLLVPSYVSFVPLTGLAFHADFEYHACPGKYSCQVEVPQGFGWVLFVQWSFTSVGPEVFQYWPLPVRATYREKRIQEWRLSR